MNLTLDCLEMMRFPVAAVTHDAVLITVEVGLGNQILDGCCRRLRKNCQYCMGTQEVRVLAAHTHLRGPS